MTDKTGAARLRQAIKNQRDAGEGEFRLTYHDAEEIADEVEDELAQLSWAKGVPAPVDADGNVVPLTTKVMYFGDSPIDVIGFHYNADNGWELYTTTLYTRLSTFNLRRPDSWEKLEEDVQKVKETGDICGYYDKVGKPCNECPARNIQGVCSAIVLRDVLRRAKALAERDAKTPTPQPSPHEAKEANCD